MTPTMRACSAGGGSLAPPDREALERRLGHRFADPALLERALMHRSWAHEQGDPGRSNERLEFLGDAVLDLVVSERLMEVDPAADEGVLSRARAAAVNTQALAEHARALELGSHVQLGRGEQRSGGAAKPSILANLFEAVVGAVYLDGGIEVARALVDRELGPALRAPSGALPDPKTRLQERLQAEGRALPRYVIVEQRGPDHARHFTVAVESARQPLGQGKGTSKREAEQAAAAAALRELEAAGS